MDLEISVELPTNEAVFLQTTVMADPSESGTGGVTLQLNISAPNVRCQTDRLLLPVSRSISGALPTTAPQILTMRLRACTGDRPSYGYCADRWEYRAHPIPAPIPRNA